MIRISENVPGAITPPHGQAPENTGKKLGERLKDATCLYENRRRMGPELPLDDTCRQIFDHLIPAMHFPAIASAMIELGGRRFTSENYREGSVHQLHASIAVHDRLCGQLRVFYPDNTSFLLPEEQDLVDAIARDLEGWLKEISFLYEIRQGAELELPLEDVCQQIFEGLIPALRFPKSATVLIELDDRRFVGEGHGHDDTHELHSKISADNKLCERGRTHELRSEIMVNKKVCGHLGVIYPEDTPFLLPEEQELIDAIVSDLERWLKEVNCLYEIRRGAGLASSLEEICQQIFAHLIPALQFPEAATVVIELDNQRFATGCEGQGLTHELHSEISADSRLRGQLRLFYPLEKSFLLPEEQRLMDALVTELEKWLEAKKINETLSQRLEEITCVYEIRRSLGLEISLDNVCQHIFTHLVPAMQFPEVATAIIELEGTCFASNSLVQGLTHELRSIITVNKRPSGQLRVFYPDDKPFRLPGEQRLIDAVARDLERWIEGKHLEETLVSVAEKYQRTIGQELHDNLGSRLRRSAFRRKHWHKTWQLPAARRPQKSLHR
jgi:hypothetical protein